MRVPVAIGVLALTVAGCGGSSAPKPPPPLGRGVSLEAIAVYQLVDATYRTRHVRVIRMALGDLDGKPVYRTVDRNPLYVLHPTAAEVIGSDVLLYAPEATDFIQYQQEVGGFFVGLFDNRGYDVGTVGGDPNGLNVSLRVGAAETRAIAIAKALTTRIRVVSPATPS